MPIRKTSGHLNRCLLGQVLNCDFSSENDFPVSDKLGATPSEKHTSFCWTWARCFKQRGKDSVHGITGKRLKLAKEIQWHHHWQIRSLKLIAADSHWFERQIMQLYWKQIGHLNFMGLCTTCSNTILLIKHIIWMSL